MARILLQDLVNSFEGKADLAIMSGGNIRGGDDYNNQKWFTLTDLQRIFPYDDIPIVISLPGEIIEKMIFHSRESEWNENRK
jgi:2',3'-cyclic-nucleotide 2'-phosphodiesterase (5'-nucleotidase family)